MRGSPSPPKKLDYLTLSRWVAKSRNVDYESLIHEPRMVYLLSGLPYHVIILLEVDRLAKKSNTPITRKDAFNSLHEMGIHNKGILIRKKWVVREKIKKFRINRTENPWMDYYNNIFPQMEKKRKMLRRPANRNKRKK